MASVICDRLPELVRKFWCFISRMYNGSGKIASPASAPAPQQMGRIGDAHASI
jgi:hypothetical protein